MKLQAVYNEDDQVVSVHQTLDGANKNRDNHNMCEEGHYVDIIIIHQ